MTDMAATTTISELRRFVGIVNQLGNFSPQITSLSKPLSELLSTKRAWSWGPDQADASCYGHVQHEGPYQGLPPQMLHRKA